ncbi:clostripain-related cysteine peptidase [Cryobacterium ruanii]|nr:clostripain-related cysteine peptidase [Cryobacterium ruanii]
MERGSTRSLGRRSAAGLLFGVLLLGASACSFEADADASSAGAGSWTVLTYSIADTDLEPYMMVDVDEMGQVGSSENLSIVALVDRAADYSSDPVLGLDDWTGGKLLEINEGSATEVEDLGDVNTGDPAVLAEFVRRGIEEYPADNYALIISDHGASWPGVGGDESSDNDSLSLAEIDTALATGLNAVGVDKLDLLGFDACLMATYEVASTLAPRADLLLASQELEPGHGWDYTALDAASVPVNGQTLGSALLAGFAAQAADEGNESGITLSLVDLTRMTAVDDALATFSAALVDRAAAVAPVVGVSLAGTLGFGRSPDPLEDTHMTDLGILAGEIGVEALDVSDAADDLVRVINDAVLDKVDGLATLGATGLSIYFPPQQEYFSADYLSLDPTGGWSDFLSSYYAAGASIPAGERAQFTATEGEVSFADDGLYISGPFASAENLAKASIRYGLIEADGSITFLGQEEASFSSDGSGVAEGFFDLTTLQISDDEDTVNAYLQLDTDEDAGVTTINVPMAYYSPEDLDGETYQDVLLTITTDAETQDVLTETYYAFNADLGTYGELTADPAGIIVPEVLNVLADGSEEWLATSDYGLYADLPYLQYDFVALESGTELYIELGVVDYGGNTSTVSARVTVP